MFKHILIPAVAGATLLCTACGTQPTTAAPSTTISSTANNTTNNSTNNTTGNTSSNTTNSSNTTTGATNNSANTTAPTSSTGAGQPLQLKAFTDSSLANVNVQVPLGWTKMALTGGDYSGFKFVNPNDKNEYEIVAESTCVGCYMSPDGKSDASRVIPQDATNAKILTKSAHEVTYQYKASDSPYQGQGRLITSQNKSGYAYVQVIFAPKHRATATIVLNEFKLNS